MVVNLQREYGGVKQVKAGFSWTTFFFGALVPLFRGDWLWFLIMLVAQFVTAGLASIIFAFIYNKIYINSLLSKGYKPVGEADAAILRSKVN